MPATARVALWGQQSHCLTVLRTAYSHSKLMTYLLPLILCSYITGAYVKTTILQQRWQMLPALPHSLKGEVIHVMLAEAFKQLQPAFNSLSEGQMQELSCMLTPQALGPEVTLAWQDDAVDRVWLLQVMTQ